MLKSLLTKRDTISVLLCIFTAISIVRLHGQDKPQVAPPSKSDSFATDERGKKFRVQHREVAGTNFQIAGVDLAFRGDFFEQTFRIMGKFDIESSGDAGTSLGEVCYRSTDGNDSTYIIFSEGEVARSFTLSSDGSVWKWKSPCKRSPKVNRSLATASGLHLGQTQEQVIDILGLPTRHSRNIKNGRDDMEYVLEARKKTDPRDLAIMMQQEMQISQSLTAKEREYIVKDFHENNDYYDLSVWIRAKFIKNALIKLEITWIATT
jgi:hypothetical protein